MPADLSPELPRVLVDFNNLRATGQVLGTQRRRSGTERRLQVGDRVIVEDPPENMAYTATVAEASDDTERIVLDVDWEDVS